MQNNVTKKDILRYAALPGFKGRLHDLFATGFQYIPYFIALVYGAVGLLPANHPYLLATSIGRFGIRHVIAEAANNIVISKRNIDQIILFICILFGLVIATLQIGILGVSIFVQPVLAAMPTNFAGFFITPAPAQDIAHMMLDMVFGVPGLFDSCVTTSSCVNAEGNPIARAAVSPGVGWALQPTAFPTPLHEGLHQLFQLYNIGLTVVATFIASYFIVTVVLETAQSGQPFGRRFNKVWAPVRFVVAFGLLFPVGLGYNSAQYIVLYAAKFGSGFATNGWTIFNDTLAAASPSGLRSYVDSVDGDSTNLITTPGAPEVGNLLQFLYVAKVCSYAEDISNRNIPNPMPSGRAAADYQIKPFVVYNTSRTPSALELTGTTTYDQVMNFIAGDNQIVIRFGYVDPTAEPNSAMMGYVYPTCGEITLRLEDPRPVGQAEAGVEAMQRYYIFLLQELWFTALEGQAVTGGGTTYITATNNYAENAVICCADFVNGTQAQNPSVAQAAAAWRTQLRDFYAQDVLNAMGNPGASGLGGVIGTGAGGAIQAMQQSNRWDVDPNVRDKGWAGAAIWYNRIAELNGAFTSAVLNVPQPNRYPFVMERVRAEKSQNEENIDPSNQFDPKGNDRPATEGLSTDRKKMAGILNDAYQFWLDGDFAKSAYNATTGNSAIDIVNELFGTAGLFNIRQNTDAHPLAQLVGVGRSLIEGALRNLSRAAVGAIANKALNSSLVSNAAGFLITFAMIGLTAGFILFYVVPFLPFIYFFFAFGGWIKGIFEAMVGAPLWALAHLRIDGNGLPGSAAVSGYFLIFEVFLRPILILFGLLGSISIFSALVSVLNITFSLVVENVAGFDVTASLAAGGAGGGGTLLENARGALDQFFFTVIYTIIVYLVGLSSFKLVDLVPNNILRWMGQSVSTFGDQREDIGQGLIGTTTVGAQQTFSAVGQGLGALVK